MIRETLLNTLRKYSKISSRKIRLTFSLFIILFLVGLLGFGKLFQMSESNKTLNSKAESKKTIVVKENTPEFRETENEIIYGEITEKKISPTPTPSQEQALNIIDSNNENSADSPGLLASVNAFRNSNGLSSLSSSGGLCDIASKRLSELQALGNLDKHAGFSKYFQNQSEFNAMGEVIFRSSNRTSPEYAVNQGWAKSTSGHRENMLDAKWNYGCGATDGYFAVFNFGKK